MGGIGCAQDFEFIVNAGPVVSLIVRNECISELMQTYGINQVRCSMDKWLKNVGHSLVDFCISLVIFNGIVGEDAGVGKFTCKNASVVDYVPY